MFVFKKKNTRGKYCSYFIYKMSYVDFEAVSCCNLIIARLP